MTETKPGMSSFTEEQIRGWIREEEDVIRAWIVDEMKRFFNLANKAQMDQQIKVIEACGFKVIPEEAPAPASGDDDQGPDDSKMPSSTSPQDTIDRIKDDSYVEPDDNSQPTASLHERI